MLVVLLHRLEDRGRTEPYSPDDWPWVPLTPPPTPVPSTPHACSQPPRSSGLRPARLACCAVGGESRSPGHSGSHPKEER